MCEEPSMTRPFRFGVVVPLATDLPTWRDRVRRIADSGYSTLFETTLEDPRRVLGDDHPDTLASRNNLAYAYQSAGELARAIPLYETTLQDPIRVLGEDHPSTLVSRDNLAGAYESTGDLARAIP